MKLVVKPAARRDILAQAVYFAEQGGEALANRFLHSAENSLTHLLDHPRAGAPKFFDNPALAGLRSWPVANFEDVRAYYLATSTELSVLRVLHGKRDLPHILGDG